MNDDIDQRRTSKPGKLEEPCSYTAPTPEEGEKQRQERTPKRRPLSAEYTVLDRRVDILLDVFDYAYRRSVGASEEAIRALRTELDSFAAKYTIHPIYIDTIYGAALEAGWIRSRDYGDGRRSCEDKLYELLREPQQPQAEEEKWDAPKGITSWEVLQAKQSAKEKQLEDADDEE